MSNPSVASYTSTCRGGTGEERWKRRGTDLKRGNTKPSRRKKRWGPNAGGQKGGGGGRDYEGKKKPHFTIVWNTCMKRPCCAYGDDKGKLRTGAENKGRSLGRRYGEKS